MPRIASTMTNKQAMGKLKPGLHAAGGDAPGLYLSVNPRGAKSWVYRYSTFVDGKRSVRAMGLGSFPLFGLADAREKARELRRQRAEGVDPWQARRDAKGKTRAAATAQAKAQAAGRVTFEAAAKRFLTAHQASWKNPKHRAQWGRTLEVYAFPVIGKKPVGDVVTADVLAILEPIWRTTPETAKRVRGRVEQVLDYAAALDLRPDDNPARWQGKLAKLLPARSKVRATKHHAAMPHGEVPGFMVRLQGRTDMGALALQLAVLTACRSGEVLKAKWGEVDLAARVWSIPAARMKAGKPHLVPLSDAAVAVLEKARGLRIDGNDYVFPGQAKGRPLSDMAMTMILRRLKLDVTVHGFRSSFRDWAAETTAYPADVVEAALAHVVADKVAAAYLRTDFFEKRRSLMAEWAAHCVSEPDYTALA